MKTSNQPPGSSARWISLLRLQLPAVPHALASLMQTVIVALFLLTFVLQPYLIPSESMERTLLVGDFLLANKQVFAPADRFSRHLLPYRSVKRGDIVFFYYSQPPFMVKRVVGLPGDRLRIVKGRVLINGKSLDQPYAVFEPNGQNPSCEDFPASVYTDPNVDPAWWLQMQNLTQNGELEVPPGEYFVLGDNRNHSKDSRDWGFVSRAEITAKPLAIYFSLARPSTTDRVANAQPSVLAANDKLGHDRELWARLSGQVRWKRIFLVVH